MITLGQRTGSDCIWGLQCREIEQDLNVPTSSPSAVFYQKLNALRRREQHSNPSSDHAAKAAGKNYVNFATVCKHPCVKGRLYLWKLCFNGEGFCWRLAQTIRHVSGGWSLEGLPENQEVVLPFTVDTWILLQLLKTQFHFKSKSTDNEYVWYFWLTLWLALSFKRTCSNSFSHRFFCWTYSSAEIFFWLSSFKDSFTTSTDFWSTF